MRCNHFNSGSLYLFHYRKEMKEWSEIMLQRMAELKPLVLCFNGKGIYEIYRGKKCEIGIQEERLPGTDTVKTNCIFGNHNIVLFYR